MAAAAAVRLIRAPGLSAAGVRAGSLLSLRRPGSGRFACREHSWLPLVPIRQASIQKSATPPRAASTMAASTNQMAPVHEANSESPHAAEGYGIEALEAALLPLSYRRRDRLEFPKKRLRAYWYAPPAENTAGKGAGREDDGLGTLLPRVFVSEIAVEELSSKAQEVISKYLSASGPVQRHALLASALGTLPWPKPTYQDYQLLAAESEYAAWTLVNGYALNHATVSTHSLHTLPTLDHLNAFVVDDMRFCLNDEGGTVKVSPDGALRQSSTVADTFQYAFASQDGEQDELQTVAGSYIEFAERDVLPQYASLPFKEVAERHRRDGFEVGNADGIFESTSMRQTQRA
eukprot:jgi/Chlat1/3267/Chrsp22S03520